MKLFTIALLIVIHVNTFGQESWTNKSRILPDELRQIPVSLIIYHTPNPNYPELNKDASSSQYVWKHATSIWSPDQNFEFVSAGSFIWYSEEGWKHNVVLNKKQFAQRFNCLKGKIEKGIRYTFEKNYRYGNDLFGGDALWYVIAKDENGNLHKGMAIIETESELK